MAINRATIQHLNNIRDIKRKRKRKMRRKKKRKRIRKRIRGGSWMMSDE